jgi:hypothetical protein
MTSVDTTMLNEQDINNTISFLNKLQTEGYFNSPKNTAGSLFDSAKETMGITATSVGAVLEENGLQISVLFSPRFKTDNRTATREDIIDYFQNYMRFKDIIYKAGFSRLYRAVCTNKRTNGTDIDTYNYKNMPASLKCTVTGGSRRKQSGRKRGGRSTKRRSSRAKKTHRRRQYL